MHIIVNNIPLIKSHCSIVEFDEVLNLFLECERSFQFINLSSGPLHTLRPRSFDDCFKSIPLIYYMELTNLSDCR